MNRAWWWALIVVCSSSGVHAQIGYYKFAVTASDVKVFLNDQELRKTSEFIFSGAAVEGKYKLKVAKKGFNDFEREIQITSDELLEMTIELGYAEVLRMPPRRPEPVVIVEESGKFVLLSDPPELPVKVGNLSWDQTPVTLVNYPAGAHRLTIGNVSRNINLLPYGIRRLRLRNNEIREVNWEIERPEHGPVRLEKAQIAFTKSSEELENWKTAKLQKYADGGMPDPIFKIDEDEWHLLCFLTFSNQSNDTMEFAQEFKIVNDGGEINKHQGITKVAPREREHSWLYHILRTWKPGYYSIMINDDQGPMAVIFFSLHH